MVWKAYENWNTEVNLLYVNLIMDSINRVMVKKTEGIYFQFFCRH